MSCVIPIPCPDVEGIGSAISVDVIAIAYTVFVLPVLHDFVLQTRLYFLRASKNNMLCSGYLTVESCLSSLLVGSEPQVADTQC